MAKNSFQKKASSTPSPVKKIFSKHNVRSQIGQKARYELHTFETAVEEVIISYACRKDNKNVSAYIKPIVDFFNEQLEAGNTNISSDYRVSSFMPRRVVGSLTNNNTIKTGKDEEYEWESIVTINPDAEVSSEDIGNTISIMFSRFHTEMYKQQRFVPVFHQEEEKKPVNYYIQDENVVT